VPKGGDGSEIFAQGMALFALADPEALRSIEGFNDLVRRVAETALQVLQDGRLSVREGELAFGWAEVFPKLTEDERRLGQLPGFTAERIDQFREEYPAEVLGLPDNTGSPPEGAPVGNVISTPISGEAAPTIFATERTQEELDALASDPAHGGRTTDKTVREREVGLGSDPSGAAEFIDANGQAWDVKGFRSDFSPTQGGFDLVRDMEKVERELAAGHNVIIDTQNMSESDIDAMKDEVDLRGLRERVVFWP
jgi:hypothetical protein